MITTLHGHTLQAPLGGQVPRRPSGPDHVMDVLRDAINDSHLTQQMIAKRCDMSLGAVNKIATGKTQWPRPTTFVTLCLLLNLELTLRRRS